MSDLDLKIEINDMLSMAYDTTIKSIHAIETSPEPITFRTMLVENNDYPSYLNGYMNYYSGMCEGLLFSIFLEKFQRMPTSSENTFIKESYINRFEELKKIIIDFSTKAYKADTS